MLSVTFAGRLNPRSIRMQARLLVVDAKHRLTAKQALQHPWMQVSPPPQPL